MKDNLGIYIHIPFCLKKCNYCDFVSGCYNSDIQEQYVNRLIKEIEENQYLDGKNADTVFIGGGTPSCINPKYIGEILCALSKKCHILTDSEITIESNPGTLNIDKLSLYKNFGINRLSMGLQSADNSELKILGRIHTYEDFLRNYDDAREIGFENINVDLMSAIPEQSLSGFIRGLELVKKSEPEHISIYSLILEEGTPFYNMKLNLCGEDEEREMIHSIPKILGDKYKQYEISNYSKPGFECKHNIKYWNRSPYVGFGVAAASLTGEKAPYNIRSKNTENIQEYIDSKRIPLSENECLSIEEMMSEYMILSLRMNSGSKEKEFKEMFGTSFFDVYPDEIKKHEDEGLLEKDEDGIRLSEPGRDVCNYVMKDFI